MKLTSEIWKNGSGTYVVAVHRHVEAVRAKGFKTTERCCPLGKISDPKNKKTRVKLSDRQQAMINSAAAAFCRDQRDQFVTEVRRLLSDAEVITDLQVYAAIEQTKVRVACG